MCGIVGVFNRKDADKFVVKALDIIKNRGKDGFGICNEMECKFAKELKGLKVKASKHALGHALHSVVSLVFQPFAGKGKFAANSEIYNWKELNDKYGLKAKNDSEALFKLVESKGVEATKELDGVYAFAYWSDGSLYLVRDILGEKPIWYSHSEGFAFASEKKALVKLGYLDVVELNPRQILKYDVACDKVSFLQREFFKITPEDKRSKEKIKADLKQRIMDAVSKRVPDRKFGLLLSGGVDSALIAFILKQMKKKFTCYVAVLDEPGMSKAEDLYFAEKIAKELSLDLKVVKIKLEDVEGYIKEVVPLIEDSNVVKVGVALTFFAACKQAQKGKVKVIFSGLGSEEIFGGYQRHKNSLDVNKECLSGLLKIYERDLYRDDVVTMNHNIELRLPFLDTALVDFALKIPGKHKIVGEHGKYILREIASDMGLSSEFAWRKKRAAQYGSKFDRAIEKLAHKNGFKYKSEYLRQFYPGHNLKLGALVSSGKDSIYAAYVMLRQNYSVDCLITLVSKNPDSFMFHTPNIHMVKLQAESMGIPLVEQETLGEKEKELKDLQRAIKKAKEEFELDGIITGAIFSNYQRERIERICDKLGLKMFSPLWHLNQETEIREIVNNGFEVVISSVAAYGLDKSWVGKRIDNGMIDRLVKLNEDVGINIAFEGGEAETLVLDCPLFRKKIKIIEAHVVSESENTAKFIIKKAILEGD